MPTYMALFTYADKSVRSQRETIRRAQTIKQSTEAAGRRFIGVWWQIAYYDGAIVFEASDDSSAMQQVVHSGPQDEPRSFVVRAFSDDEIDQFLADLS